MARTGKQIAAGQIRSLRMLRKKLMDMAAEWGDVDTYNESALEELAKGCEDVAVNLVDNALAAVD